MQQMFISFTTIIILCFCLPSNLFADTQTEYPKLYKSLWPEFCKDHLLNESAACSEMPANELFYETDIDQDEDEDENYNDFDIFFPFPLSIHIDVSQLENYENNVSFIPNLQSLCSYVYCSYCKKPVLKGIGILNSEWHHNWFIMNHACECSHHFLFIDSKKSYLTNDSNRWTCCKKPAVPFCYFNKPTAKYSLFLKHHLKYLKENPSCKCYWPYISKIACAISDLVYDDMQLLFQETCLSDLVNTHSDWIFVSEFSLKNWPKIEKENLLRALQNQFIFSFFYSNYHTSLIDLCTHVDANSPTSSIELQKLYSLIASIRPLFLNLYSNCLEKHPHPKIYYERGMVYFHNGDLFASLSDMQAFTESAHEDELETLLTSDFYLQEGTSYAELGQYDEAIVALTKSIAKDPSNKESYFERAAVYFETGDFDLAIADYLESGIKPTLLDSNDLISIEFSKYLMLGILKGTGEAAIDFAPSILSSINGLSHALWAFGCDPLNCSKEMIATCKEMMELLSQKSSVELLEAFIPELREFNNSTSNEEKAKLLGYMIGKYGTELFAPIGIMKTYKKFKTANKLLTLEHLAQESKQASVIKEAAGNWRQAHEDIIQKFKTTQKLLKTYKGQDLSETTVRKILHQAGFQTFPKPKNIPDTFKVTFSDKGCGMKYVHPTNPHESVRIMPGKPYSRNPYQQKPYVVHMRGNSALDKFGNIIDQNSIEAHISLDQFVYRLE
ncbi:MAG: tetratricopeptide repeat protein [Verrucomicrobia bacterium]|nr:tetratricopeptide repeat protein [Verrucomicrobiota bacterium]